MEELKEKLKLAECPSNWGLDKLIDRKPASFIIDRLFEKEEEIAEPWMQVCINLTVAYLHSENGEFIKAISMLKECDELLKTSKDELIVKYKSALEMVCIASRAVFLSTISTYSDVKQFADKIIRPQDLNKVNEAACYAIKAGVFCEFGVSGTMAAVQWAKEALKISPQEADWHFLMGKLLSRIRHFSQDHEITPSEISHFQTALSISKTARTAIFLANSYIEKSKGLQSNLYKNGGRPDFQIKNQIKELTTEAQRLIQLALDINNNQCVHILIRCAYGLTKLPHYQRDYEKAKQLLEETFKRSPSNPMANKLAGDICLQENKPKYHIAMKHFKIAASRNVYSANFSLFEIEIKLSLKPDSEKFYNRMLENFNEKSYTLLTLVHATEFYVFIRRDLSMAANYFERAIALDKDFHALKDRYVKYIQKSVNLYDLIANELRYAINNQMYSGSDQMNSLQKVLNDIKNINPDLTTGPIIPNKVQMYLDAFEYERKTNNLSKRGRGGQRGRGRGRGQGGRGRGGSGLPRDAVGNVQKYMDMTERHGYKNVDKTNTRNFENKNGRKSRSSSRNRFAIQNDQKIPQVNLNENQECFDKNQFDRIAYAGNKSLEVMENPYFVKFLELKYKKMTEIDSFKEWLRQYGEEEIRITGANKTNQKENVDSSDVKFQELTSVIHQLKQEISDIKLNDTRSCSACHSLKSLEYKKSDALRRQDEYFSDKNDWYRQNYRTSPYKDCSNKYSSSRKDGNRRKSESRRYDRLSPSRGEKDKYRHKRFYNVSPTRKGYRSSRHYDPDSSRSNESEGTASSTEYRYGRRGRRHSFSDRNSLHNNSRYSSPSRRDRRYPSPSPSSHRGRSKERRNMCVRNKHTSSPSSRASSSSAESRYHRRSNERKQTEHGMKDKTDSKYGKKAISESHKHPKYRKSSETRLKDGEKHSMGKSTRTKVSSSASSRQNSPDRKSKKNYDGLSSKTEIKREGKKNGSKEVGTNRRSSVNNEHYEGSSSDSKSDRKSRDVRISQSSDMFKKERGGDYTCERLEMSKNSKKCKNVSEHLDDKSSLNKSGMSPDNDGYLAERSFHKQQSNKKNISRLGNNDKDEYNDRKKEEKKNSFWGSKRKPEDLSHEFKSIKSEESKKYSKNGNISTSESSSEVEDSSNHKNTSYGSHNVSSARKKDVSESKISFDRDKGKQYMKSPSVEEYLSTSSG